jgi:uroporphyrinogen-III synthase
MEKTNWNILNTRPLSASLLEAAAAKGFLIDCLSFIDTEPIRSADVAQKIADVAAQRATVVFTSMNAVEAVHQYMGQKPYWRIYAIGSTTKGLAEQHLGPVLGTADSAAELADVIINNGESEATFFCGDIRRDELPEKLKAAGVLLNEVMVYRTIHLPHTLTRQYDGVLFYSPSAVHSFFEANSLAPEVVLFAIGQTTAAALNTYTTNRIYVADSPSKEGLVEDMMDFFLATNKSPTNE